MAGMYRTLAGTAEERLVEKKSIFIANAAPVADEAEAQLFLSEVKARYPDAKHHVYAYVCGDHNEFQRFSDAGEPAGTGGRPVLDVLHGQSLSRAVIVVSRYFGGILLGTGGLSRAYGKAAGMAVAAAGLVRMVPCREVHFIVDYLHYGKTQNYLETQAITVVQTDFTETVSVCCRVVAEKLPHLTEFLREIGRGEVQLTVGEEVYQAESGQEGSLS